VTVVLCGADGSGNQWLPARNDGSADIPSAKVGISGTPRYSPDARRAQPDNRPTATGSNPAVSLCYFGFHWLEFLLGSYLRIRPVTFRGGLVLIDRFYYDFFVDQRRYRLRVPQSIVRLGHFFLKKPDLVVLLDAPADMLQGRKQEVPLAETERQRAAYRELIQGLSNGRVIDATQPPEKVGADINRAILDFMAQRVTNLRPPGRARRPWRAAGPKEVKLRQPRSISGCSPLQGQGRRPVDAALEKRGPICCCPVNRPALLPWTFTQRKPTSARWGERLALVA
jgi:hypothetical protein